MKSVIVKIDIGGIADVAQITYDNHMVEFIYKELHIKKQEAGRSPYFLLSQIREELEPHNIYILCNGSRYDVFARGMGAAFILRWGEVVRKDDRVKIFDPVDTENIGKVKTVAEQRKYIYDWGGVLE